MRAVVLSNAPTWTRQRQWPRRACQCAVNDLRHLGPYTDPNAQTDIRQGLKPMRLDWIRGRGDVEELAASSYQAPVKKNGKASDPQTERFPDAARRPILRAKAGLQCFARCTTPGRALSRRRWSTSRFGKISDGSKLLKTAPVDRPHPCRLQFRRGDPQVRHAGIRARRSRARARDHSRPTSIIRKASR